MLIEGGLLEKWIKQYWPEEGNCAGSISVAAHALTLEETAGAFIVLSSGILLPGFVLLLENSTDRISLFLQRVLAMFRSAHRPTAKIHTKDQ